MQKLAFQKTNVYPQIKHLQNKLPYNKEMNFHTYVETTHVIYTINSHWSIKERQNSDMFHFESIISTGTNLSTDVSKRIQKLTKEHSETFYAVQDYYNDCNSHVEFLQGVVYAIRKFLLENGVEYSQRGLTAARDQIIPIITRFSEQKEKTDKAVQAILCLVMEYIEESPFNNNISLEDAPLLAVLGVNMFLVTFSSTIIAANGIQKAFINK